MQYSPGMVRGISLLFALLLTFAACDSRDPCRRLADRDCARHGWSSRICRDALQRAEDADPFLIEVCRTELAGKTAKP